MKAWFFSSRRHFEAVHGAALFLANWAEQPDSCSWLGNETLSPLLKKWSRLFPGLPLHDIITQQPHWFQGGSCSFQELPVWSTQLWCIWWGGVGQGHRARLGLCQPCHCTLGTAVPSRAAPAPANSAAPHPVHPWHVGTAQTTWASALLGNKHSESVSLGLLILNLANIPPTKAITVYSLSIS